MTDGIFFSAGFFLSIFRGIYNYICAPFNIAGDWIITDKVEKCTVNDDLGKQYAFMANFIQNGNTFTANAEKIAIDGDSVPREEHNRLEIKGTIKRSKVLANFVEFGAQRESTGHFSWTITKTKDQMIGSFKSSAADSSGPSVAKRKS